MPDMVGGWDLTASEWALLDSPEVRCILDGCTCLGAASPDPNEAAPGNAYWAALVRLATHFPMVGKEIVGDMFGAGRPFLPQAGEFLSATLLRQVMVNRWSFTITDPATVAFVAAACGPRAFDPLAAKGWWAHLLTEAGVEVLASDLNHPGDDVYHPVLVTDAVAATRQWGNDGRTLILSWPPLGDPVGAAILDAYTGNRVVYIGEVGGCCGDRRMQTLLGGTGWVARAGHRPPTWFGIHDVVNVYERVTGFTAKCYGAVIGLYRTYRVAKAALVRHIRNCPEGPMPWARRIRFDQVSAGGWVTAANGEWLDHWIQPEPDRLSG